MSKVLVGGSRWGGHVVEERYTMNNRVCWVRDTIRRMAGAGAAMNIAGCAAEPRHCLPTLLDA
jgi:hypothetical protein